MSDRSTAHFEHLLSPVQVGGRQLKNRIVSPPHGTYLASEGRVTSSQIDYYEALARGGVGMIVAGSWAVWPRTMPTPLTNSATDPKALGGHQELARVVHEHGALLVAQLHEPGRQAASSWHRLPLLAPSPIADPVVREIPKEMEEDELAELRDHFVRAAECMREAGWDGVEVFAAQGYGLAQFLSPQMNLRTDSYGGDLWARSRLLREVVHRVREAVGPDFVLGVRINGSDCIEGGTDIQQARDLAIMLTAQAEVDYLSVSGASNENYPLWIADMSHPHGLFVDLAAEIREVVSLPVMVTTRITEPEHAEQILQRGAADLIGMNRALIADPELPNKVRAGEVSRIRPCVGSNQGCIGRIVSGQSIRCTVNPGLTETRNTPHDPPARGTPLVVVGGGPGGLQAAKTAAESGYAVTLFEAQSELGGQLRLAARVPSRAEFGLILDYFEREVSRIGVDLLTEHTADTASIAALNPERIILATGSEPVRTGFSSHRPSRAFIPGHQLPHVLTALDVLRGESEIGTHVLIVDDDPHGQATTIAEYLAPDHIVTIVCRSPSVGLWSGSANQEALYRRLQGAGVEILTSTWVEEIGESVSICYPAYRIDKRFPVQAETVVLATGNSVDGSLYQEVRDAFPRSHVLRVGDCLAPRLLDQAIWDGFRWSQAEQDAHR